MGRRRQRRGISLGTVTMVMVTSLVVVGCFWLFPRLMGDVDLQFDASKLAVSIDQSFLSLGSSGSQSGSLGAAVLPSVEQATPSPVLVTAPKEVSFSLTATGSININSSVQKALTTDSGYRFSILLEALKSEINADLAIATLENISFPTEKLSDYNIPSEAVAAIAQGGINCLALGHDGIFNSGIGGLQATQEAVSAAGMSSYGVYASQQDREHPHIVNINGVSVALLGYQSDLSSVGKKKLSKEEQSFALAPPTLPTVAADVEAARAAGAQVVIASFSWGKKGASSPTRSQRELAQAFADAGVDIILGTRSGTVQTVETLTAHRGDGKVSQTLCAYSLGNLFTYNRENRSSIAGILLHANVIYDLSAGTVSFDRLTYSPTYVWRGKEEGKTLYRVLISDMPSPAFVQEDQQDVMDRCLALIQDVMEDTPVSPRNANLVVP
ncbi:MAG: CapA family protein [Candidatus Limiplasma sp.]|nr:CapA family protein [Candidatus Limiplasma sp.]